MCRQNLAMRNVLLHRRSSGFTLVELIIVIVLLGILAAVGSNMLSDSFRTTSMINASNAGEAEARYAVERLAREIRETKHCTGSGCLNSVSGYCISTMTSSHLVFYKRNAGDTDTATCTTGSTSVDISYSGNNLSLYGAVLTNLVDTNGFSLAYLQSDAATSATSGADVQFVKINLTVKDSTSGQAISQRLSVSLRDSS